MVKPKFVTEDVCKARMDDLADMKGDLKDIKSQVNNHILHISTDITKLNSCFSSMKDNVEFLTKNCREKKPNGTKTNNTISEKVVMRILLIILFIIVIIYGIVIDGDPTHIMKTVVNGG